MEALHRDLILYLFEIIINDHSISETYAWSTFLKFRSITKYFYQLSKGYNKFWLSYFINHNQITIIGPKSIHCERRCTAIICNRKSHYGSLEREPIPADIYTTIIKRCAQNDYTRQKGALKRGQTQLAKARKLVSAAEEHINMLESNIKQIEIIKNFYQPSKKQKKN